MPEDDDTFPHPEAPVVQPNSEPLEVGGSEFSHHVESEAKPPGHSLSLTNRLSEQILEETRNRALSLAKTIPLKIPSIKQVMKLADDRQFRKKAPILADRYSRNGAWAYSGRKPKARKADNPHNNPSLAPTNKTGRAMQKFHPEVSPFELLDHGWAKIFDELRDMPIADCIYKSMVDPLVFTARFGRKMEDRVKTLAKREARYWFDNEESSRIEDISADRLAPGFYQNNVVDMAPDDKALQRVALSKLEPLLAERPVHRDTIYNQFFLGLTVKEEAEKLNVLPIVIKRRRDAAIKYVRRAILKG